jgi:hypothetical protein
MLRVLMFFQNLSGESVGCATLQPRRLPHGAAWLPHDLRSAYRFIRIEKSQPCRMPHAA